MSDGAKGAQTTVPKRVIIDFDGGTAGTGDEPYCYSSTGGDKTITFKLDDLPGSGCRFHATVLNIGTDGRLPDGGTTDLDATALTHSVSVRTGVPSPCFYFTLVITRTCGGSAARFITAKEFKICSSC